MKEKKIMLSLKRSNGTKNSRLVALLLLHISLIKVITKRRGNRSWIDGIFTDRTHTEKKRFRSLSLNNIGIPTVQ